MLAFFLVCLSFITFMILSFRNKIYRFYTATNDPSLQSIIRIRSSSIYTICHRFVFLLQYHLMNILADSFLTQPQQDPRITNPIPDRLIQPLGTGSDKQIPTLNWCYYNLRVFIGELEALAGQLYTVCTRETCPKMQATDNWQFRCASHTNSNREVSFIFLSYFWLFNICVFLVLCNRIYRSYNRYAAFNFK